jgi:hypothetical protein
MEIEEYGGKDGKGREKEERASQLVMTLSPAHHNLHLLTHLPLYPCLCLATVTDRLGR